ncbi:MAG TPA: hypothetical protein V6C78_09690 [Crinalium sp.]|jgi:beta-lactam-binding protein with PASTA domain
MEVVCVLALVAAFFFSLSPKKEKPPKSAEEELGEALGKYLKNGVKINVEISNKSDKS